MSWSNSAGGSAQEIQGTCAGWAAAQEKVDASWNAAPEVVAGHQAQIAGAIVAIEAICGAFPGRPLTISANGHANLDGSGNTNVSYSFRSV